MLNYINAKHVIAHKDNTMVNADVARSGGSVGIRIIGRPPNSLLLA